MLGTFALSAGYYDALLPEGTAGPHADPAGLCRGVPVGRCPGDADLAGGCVSLGEKMDDPLQMYLVDVCTLPVNIAGLPALSVPCAFPRACRWACS